MIIMIIFHVIYYIRGADDDMRKEDCISSESRLILGPVIVEISNLKYFDNLLKNFISKGWRSPHMSEQGKTICH